MVVPILSRPSLMLVDMASPNLLYYQTSQVEIWNRAEILDTCINQAEISQALAGSQTAWLPSFNKALQHIAKWKHIIVTDLTSTFYQIPLAHESMKYCSVTSIIWTFSLVPILS